MAQSRPPPSRVHTTPSTSTTHNSALTSPLQSPRSSHHHHHHGEKRHHSRRNSGKTDHVSPTDKKSSTSHSRPSLARRQPPSSKSDTRSSRPHTTRADRSDREEERGRDSGESFPQFCMSCEKQFLPTNNVFLYCSEACRLHDLNPSGPLRTTSFPGPLPTSTFSSHSPPLTPYSLQFPATTDVSDGPDIIPRFSPTQSRPRSYFSSEPYPGSYQTPSALSASVPHSKPREHEEKASKSNKRSGRSTHGSSSALESLREIADALPKTDRKHRKASRDDHTKESSEEKTSSSIKRNGSGVWNYIPFTSSTISGTHITTPALSYSQSSTHSYSNGNGSSREDLHQPVSSYSYANNAGTSYGGVSYSNVNYAQYTTSTGGMGMDRPLPPRGGPGHRPKSIDLVTPFGGAH